MQQGKAPHKCPDCQLEYPRITMKITRRCDDCRKRAISVSNSKSYQKNLGKSRARNQDRYAADPEKARASSRAWRERNLDKARASTLAYMRKSYAADPIMFSIKRRAWMYGTTPEWIIAKHAAQNGICGLCPELITVAAAHIDHDHSCCSMEERRKACGSCMRDLLCARCNAILGFAADDADLLIRAAKYVRAFARV